MGVSATDTAGTDKAITKALIGLRKGMKQPMREFANTVGISERSVVRFEQGAIPKRALLKRFAEVARANGFITYEAIFLSRLTRSAPNAAEQLIHMRMIGEILNNELQLAARNGGISKADLKKIADHMNAAMRILRKKIKIDWLDVMNQAEAEQVEQ